MNFIIWFQVRHSINTGHPMCVDYIQPGFLTFATTFAPYKKYCAEQSTCQFYCKDLHRNNALFQAYLAWCEGQKLCNRCVCVWSIIETFCRSDVCSFHSSTYRLRLADILVRPMQRLTKYSLLLSAIRRHITDENDGEIMDAMVSHSDYYRLVIFNHPKNFFSFYCFIKQSTLQISLRIQFSLFFVCNREYTIWSHPYMKCIYNA